MSECLPDPTGPFVSELFSFPAHLLESQNYATSSGHYVAQLNLLSQTYSGTRTVMGDGSCFYRSFLYGLIMQLADKGNEDERVRIEEYIKGSLATLTSQGYEEMIMEGFQEELLDLLSQIPPSRTSDEINLHNILIHPNGPSQMSTWYCRPLCSSYIKSNPETFKPVLLIDYPSIDSYCKSQIEPSSVESEEISIQAIVSAFGVKVNVEYLDGHDGEKVMRHVFGEGRIEIDMLYRPGHYDLLYRK